MDAHADPGGTPGPIAVTGWLHTRMRVADMDAAVQFYTQVLGCAVASRHRSPRGSELVFLRVPGAEQQIELCGFPGSGPVAVPEDLVHLAFQVADLDATVRRLEALGVPITDGPTRSASGRFCFIDAPDGYEIELIAHD